VNVIRCCKIFERIGRFGVLYVKKLELNYATIQKKKKKKKKKQQKKKGHGGGEEARTQIGQ